MDRVEVGGLRIGYTRAGSGPTVALAHGFVGDGLSTWSRQIDVLSQEFTVVAWDVPGAGASSDPPDSFRIGDYADCFVAFLRALDVRQAHLVGLSFGGILLLSVAERHAQVPRSLSLVSSYAGWRGSFPADQAHERLQRCLRLSELPPEEFAEAMLPSMFSDEARGADVAAFAASVHDFRPPGFRRLSTACAEADLRHVLSGVDVPTMVVHADRDVRAPRHVADALHAGIAASRLVVLPGAGHVCSVEAPDAVSRALLGFLRSVESRTV